MSEENTQAVVEDTKAPAAPGAEVDNARGEDADLDTLLKEFETTTEPAKTQPEQKAEAATTTKADDGTSGRLQQVESFIFRQDMDKTIKAVRGDIAPEIADDDLVEAFIDAQARKNPALARAWTNRYANPKAFEKVVGALSKDFGKKFSQLPDRQATEDRSAVTAAVRGASTKAPEGKAPDYHKMSNAELDKEWEKFGV